MKIIVSENQLYKYILNWLNNKYGNLFPTEKKEDGLKITFYRDKNKNVIFYCYKYKGKMIFHFNDNFIINHLETFFDMNFIDDIRSILKYWLEETYSFENINTNNIHSVNERYIENFKLWK